MLNALKRFLVGQPLRTSQAVHERLTKRVALAVFASDALSSVAYATEEILLVLAVAAAYAHDRGPFFYVLPISLVIAVLLWLVTSSYRQTIHAYPSGGGAYIVAKENLGTTAGLTAAAALLVDYVLTVWVSVAAGVVFEFANLNALKLLYATAVINGVLAPFLLTGILIAASDKRLMRGQPTSRLGRAVVGVTTVVMFGATIGMFVT